MSDWIDIKELKPQNIERQIFVKFETGEVRVRLVSSVLKQSSLMAHNLSDYSKERRIFFQNRIMTHYKEIE